MATKASSNKTVRQIAKLAGLGPVSFGVSTNPKTIKTVYLDRTLKKTAVLKGKRKSREHILSAVFGVPPQEDLATLLRETRTDLELDQNAFSELLSCSLRSLTDYEKGEPVKESVRIRLRELRRLLELLQSVIPDRKQLLAWLHSQVQDLGNRTPLQAFAAGDSGDIYALVYGTLAGVAQ